MGHRLDVKYKKGDPDCNIRIDVALGWEKLISLFSLVGIGIAASLVLFVSEFVIDFWNRMTKVENDVMAAKEDQCYEIRLKMKILKALADDSYADPNQIIEQLEHLITYIKAEKNMR